jgi:outer membrane protein assembly factor BamB
MLRTTVFATLMVISAAALAGDWPQFMGPNRDGTAPGETLATSWPDGGPKVLWAVGVGRGFAGPAILDGRVFLLDRPDNDRDVLRVLDLKTGRELWKYAYAARGRLSYNGSRSTPAVDAERAVTVGPFGEIHCISRKTHRPMWSKHFQKDYGAKRPRWGHAQSALIDGDQVIFAPLSRDVGVVAVDKNTGKELWRSKPFGKQDYQSPHIRTIAGRRMLIMSSHDKTVGLDPKTGSALWEYAGWRCNIPIAGAAHVGDGLFFISGGYGAGTVLIEVKPKGDAFAVRERFRIRKKGSHIHLPFRIGDHLYAQFNTKRDKDGLTCLDLNGRIKWQTGRSPNFDWGGMILADGGLMLAMDGNDGRLRLVKPDPVGYRELASAKVLSGKVIWGPMALSSGLLVCRDQKQMKCVVVGGK